MEEDALEIYSKWKCVRGNEAYNLPVFIDTHVYTEGRDDFKRTKAALFSFLIRRLARTAHVFILWMMANLMIF